MFSGCVGVISCHPFDTVKVRINFDALVLTVCVNILDSYAR